MTDEQKDSLLIYLEARPKRTTDAGNGAKINLSTERCASLRFLIANFSEGAFKLIEASKLLGTADTVVIAPEKQRTKLFWNKFFLRTQNYLLKMVSFGILHPEGNARYKINHAELADFQKFLLDHPNKDKNAAIFGEILVNNFITVSNDDI